MDDNGNPAVSQQGRAIMGDDAAAAERADGLPLLAHVPALTPDRLGDPVFKSAHGLTYPYVAGAMANGITSVEMVEAVGKAGMIGFFGAAGLSIERVEAAIVEVQNRLVDAPYGFNLIHSPHDPALEAAVVDLYLKHGVHRVSASAYLRLTPHLVYYRLKGIHRNAQGAVVCPNQVVAKVSRIEVARQFFSPAPEKILKHLIADGKITEAEAELARKVPIAHDLTAEADSGGHTDNRPALALLPTMQALKNEMYAKHGYDRPLCVGLGGGIATPDAAAAAFAMGAAYVITGTVNQACIESGTCDAVRSMLAEARQADVIMAPAADMFEMGVKVQVLKRGTMFAVRAGKLYDLYKRFNRFEEIPEKERNQVERDFLRCSFSEEWENTRRFFARCDPRQVERAETDPHHKMALVFRSYLGRSSKWSVNGEADRQMDYQIWCGPAIGAFNQWVRGSFLEQTENRKTVTVAMNLLLGAAVATRINWLRCQGVSLSPQAGRIVPLPLERIEAFLEK
ncbi:MAG: PfaD family polyunsaturated fatty acid/polyketide biosynthesis protein [Desulfobacterales bacterium]|nr:PfaD family polyunsaturated fatty acid/polyketide biosynthesis protein [Desulfobacterales bacterium]